MSALALLDARVVDARGEREAHVLVRDRRIERVAASPPAVRDAERVQLGGALLTPGFIDLHVHGGGGAAFTGGDEDACLAAAAFHAGHGTTGLLGTTIAAAPGALRGAVAAIGAAARREPIVLGCHLEGPFVSRKRPGAMDPDAMRAPDAVEADSLLAAGAGAVRMLSLAPELPGAVELTRSLTRRGVVVALGHSDATLAQAQAAIAAGARHAIHAFNAMRPLHHREPGILGAVLDAPEVTCELIADGFHVDPVAMRLVLAAKGRERVALVTDAMEAAGMPDGGYRLGERPVEVRGGRATLPEGGSLAGSTLTMDRAVANCVRLVRAPLATAVGLATTVPARVLGLADRKGLIEPGYDADLAILDAALAVTGTLVGGRWRHRA